MLTTFSSAAAPGREGDSERGPQPTSTRQISAAEMSQLVDSTTAYLTNEDATILCRNMRGLSVRLSAWLVSMILMCIGWPASAAAPAPSPLYPGFPIVTPATFPPLSGRFYFAPRGAILPMRAHFTL